MICKFWYFWMDNQMSKLYKENIESVISYVAFTKKMIMQFEFMHSLLVYHIMYFTFGGICDTTVGLDLSCSLHAHLHHIIDPSHLLWSRIYDPRNHNTLLIPFYTSERDCLLISICKIFMLMWSYIKVEWT